MKRSSVLLTLAFAFGLTSCTPESADAEPEKRPKKTVTKKVAAKDKANAKDKLKEKEKPTAPAEARVEGPVRYVVPFAWEASQQEPLAQTRAYLKEILTDNQIYMSHGPAFFAAFADGQKPRATVVTCADSRVHTPAFDSTPENDDFMIRNIGNQVQNSLGSIEYGVEHLETPVLLILGHTGCGAVKAAMGDVSQQSEPVRKELEKLVLPAARAGASAEAAWAEAVTANVKSQVSFALTHFGARVQEGSLTVIGAVYDFRNDLGNGSGRVTIIDVNGNSEPERMRAFVEAVEADPLPIYRKKETVPGTKKTSHAAEQADRAIADALGQIPGLVVNNPTPPSTELRPPH